MSGEWGVSGGQGAGGRGAGEQRGREKGLFFVGLYQKQLVGFLVLH